MSLSGVADWLAQRLPGDRRVILPRQLPEGWAVADDDQSFSDLVSYGSEQNPWVQARGMAPAHIPSRTGWCFTDGRLLVAPLPTKWAIGERRRSTPFWRTGA